MKVAIATDWFAPRRGGIESQLEQLATRLAQRGHEIDVLTSTPTATDGPGYRVRQLGGQLLPGGGTSLAMAPALLPSLRRELRRGYSVVHAHVSVVSPAGYAAAAVARSLGLPTVVTFHSVLRHKRLLLRAADALLGLAASSVVWTGVSDLVASQVRGALDGAQVTVLPNGIDLGFWSAPAGFERAQRAADATFISAMRLHRKKRPRQLLAAFAQAVARSGTAAVLRIAGDGPERNAMERDMRELGLDRGVARVEMLGWLPPDALRAAYAQSDCFVLPSTRESFGIAALEAAATGLPVLAMADSGCREFLSDGQLCRDDADLTRAMARIMTTPPEGPPRAARDMSLHRYDWNTVLEKHETTYQRAMQRRVASAAAVAL